MEISSKFRYFVIFEKKALFWVSTLLSNRNIGPNDGEIVITQIHLDQIMAQY